MTSPGIAHPDGAFDRMPPHDLHAEMCVLGGMLLSADAIAEVRDILAPGDHYRPAHQIVHESILRLDDAGEPADAVTVADDLRKRDEISKTGGPQYLHDVLAAVPMAANAAWYARIVRRHAVARNAITAGTRIAQIGYDAGAEPEDIADQARVFADAILPAPAAGGVKPIGDLFYEVLDSLQSEKPRGLPTPWADINDAIPGLAPGEFIVIGASSGTGKSIAGLNLCAHLALRCNVPAVIFTMEMTAQEVMQRLISAESGVRLKDMVHRNVSDQDWHRIEHVRERIISSPLVIDDTPGLSIASVRSRLRQMARSQPAGIAFVDYLGLLADPGGAENRQTAVAANARALKLIAGEFGIPIVAAAQLNREMEKRADKRPQPSDLRDSAEIEYAASVIILLYREDVHGEETPRAGDIEFIIPKNRNGAPCCVTLAFQGYCARCVNLSPKLPPPPRWTPSSAMENR